MRPRKRLVAPVLPEDRRSQLEVKFEKEIMPTLNGLVAYLYEAMTFRLAKRTTYTPDFMLIFEDRIEFVEVKGYWRDDAKAKFKISAEKFPWFRWAFAMYKNKKEGWIITYVN